MNTKDKGVIYILTNPAFPNYQKIGKSGNLDSRLASLNNKSCLPFSFRVYATYEVEQGLAMVEEEIFKIIDNIDDTLRAIEEKEKGKFRKREFFAIDCEKAYSVLESIAKLRGDLHNLKLIEPTKDEIVEANIAQEVENQAISRKADRFCFSKKGIPLGATISFIDDCNITVEVVSNNPPMVHFEGKMWRLSPLVALLKRRKGTATPSQAYQGAAYFLYNGKKLVEIDDVDDTDEI